MYVPKGVEVPLPLQAYFRINGENTGQFERTLIVVDEGAKVHYIEGCTAPDLRDRLAPRRRSSRSSRCPAPRSATRRSRTGRTTSTTSSPSAPTRTRTRPSSGSTPTPARARRSSSRRSTCAARAPRPTSSRVAVAGKGQHQDTGAKAIHLAPEHALADRQQVGLQGRRPGDLPRPAQGRAGRHQRRRQRPLRRADARRHQPQRHVPVHRHPGRRHDDDPRGDRRQGQRGPGLLPDEPRPDRERGDQNLIVQGFLEVFTKELPMEYAIEFNRLVKLEMEGSLG